MTTSKKSRCAGLLDLRKDSREEIVHHQTFDPEPNPILGNLYCRSVSLKYIVMEKNAETDENTTTTSKKKPCQLPRWSKDDDNVNKMM
eukprot:CAMPEP_0116866656 /NCGR_PEP_ID=MMETSP0418-20121206/26153_1 /TAXON_ID=1158023 /ORGANISM="Astrosyne radiata, Strain 13vi08-1A" /LENGTH=87 /DNA_ID=CAMNT_0004502321 /DNA_START=67 /DNA_END=328 /DNA_ORIENTATION=-